MKKRMVVDAEITRCVDCHFFDISGLQCKLDAQNTRIPMVYANRTNCFPNWCPLETVKETRYVLNGDAFWRLVDGLANFIGGDKVASMKYGEIKRNISDHIIAYADRVEE